MTNPLVSVIIATYRRENSLNKALNSLVKQTYNNFEIIIVDDNANNEWNNKVSNIVNNLKLLYPKNQILYIKNGRNCGSANTRNIGINVAKGKYVTFLDDDDEYLPEKIEKQVSMMEQISADYSLMNLSLYNEDEKLCEVRKRDYLNTEEGKDLLLCHLKYHMTGTDTMMFKNDYIKSFGGFTLIDVGDEFYLMMKAIENKGKFIYVDCNEVKAYVHTGEEGLSSGKSKIDGENKLFEFKKKYFLKLTNKDIRYIKMRHFAVLAYAYKRNHKYIKCFFECFNAFFIAPLQFIGLVINMK